MLTDFRTWIVAEARRADVDPSVLRGYEAAFRDQLRGLIGRTEDPAWRARLEEMLDCPVRDRGGRCRGFAEYIHAALVRHGIHRGYDVEAALQYVAQKMLMPRSEATGAARSNLFSGFAERPGPAPDFHPLQARFLAFLGGAINNIRKGRVPRLRDVERRPPGTVSIGTGRRAEGDPGGGVSPDELPGRPSDEVALRELVHDLEEWLRREQRASGLPLVGLLRAALAGQTTEQQRQRFGDRRARRGRQALLDAVGDYARATGNTDLQRLLARLRGDPSGTAVPSRPKPVTAPKPVLSDRERDYASILAVLDRLGRPAGSADLGRYRRRWLDYPPRDGASGHQNRLEEVLANMVRDGVVVVRPTGQGASRYSPGPNAGAYRRPGT